ncbi:hypothetical protein EDB89DRAFT_1903485 [Lactarius sanguifluus]|nr:hypothetical protein EDB89DRAFT_1903485 [Lactarius sanguifluus]
MGPHPLLLHHCSPFSLRLLTFIRLGLGSGRQWTSPGYPGSSQAVWLYIQQVKMGFPILCPYCILTYCEPKRDGMGMFTAVFTGNGLWRLAAAAHCGSIKRVMMDDGTCAILIARQQEPVHGLGAIEAQLVHPMLAIVLPYFQSEGVCALPEEPMEDDGVREGGVLSGEKEWVHERLKRRAAHATELHGSSLMLVEKLMGQAHLDELQPRGVGVELNALHILVHEVAEILNGGVLQCGFRGGEPKITQIGEEMALLWSYQVWWQEIKN